MKPLALFGFALAFGLTATGTARTEDKPAKPGVQIKGAPDLVDVVQIASGVSKDNQAVTVLFRNNQVGVGTGPGPLVHTRTTTVSIPLDNTDKATKLTQDVRGFVSVEGKARAVLVIQAAGKTTVVDLKKSEIKVPEPVPAEGAAKEAQELAKAQAKLFPTVAKGAKSFDFHHRFDGTVAAGAAYQVTFILLVERDSGADGAGATVTVDSFDMELKYVK